MKGFIDGGKPAAKQAADENAAETRQDWRHNTAATKQAAHENE